MRKTGNENYAQQCQIADWIQTETSASLSEDIERLQAEDQIFKIELTLM